MFAASSTSLTGIRLARRSVRAAVRELYSDDSDARRSVVDGFVYFGLIHAQLAAVLLGALPRWTLPLLLPLWMARLTISRHELLHAPDERQVDAATRLWLLQATLTPLSAGYREYRALHQRHHRYLLTDGDPDRYLIRHGRLRSLGHCLTAPEQTLVRWVLDYGSDSALVGPLLLRSAFFWALVLVSGTTFWWYWAPLRLTYGLALFLLSHAPHRRGNREGVFPLTPGPIAATALRILFGRIGLHALCNHDVHHVNAQIAPLRLAEARQLIDATAH